MTTGRLVAFEGGDGCGKSTQAARLAKRLGAVLTREPGGTAVGERLRALVLDPATVGLDARAEALLMAAARAQHMAEVIGPALADGRDVVTDRFTGSSLAYQGVARGLGVAEVAALSRFAAAPEPDLVVLIQVDADEADRRRAGAGPDRIEAEHSAFHQRVLDAFASLAAARPDQWLVICGDGTPDEVERRVLDAVASRLALPELLI